MQECAQNDIRIITLDDPEYPTLLKNIYSPPIVLFVLGSLIGFWIHRKSPISNRILA